MTNAHNLSKPLYKLYPLNPNLHTSTSPFLLNLSSLKPFSSPNSILLIMSSSNPNKMPKRFSAMASKKKGKEKVSLVFNVEGWLLDEKDKYDFKQF